MWPGTSEPLALPEWQSAPGDPRRALSAIFDWVNSSALREVVAAFTDDAGASPWDSSRPQDLAGLLERLDHFSLRWDFRAGGERDGATGASFGDLQSSVVERVSACLGLADRSTPSRRHYDVMLLTGGMVRAAIVKPRFVAELFASGLSATAVVFLGAARDFSQAEELLAAQLGLVLLDDAGSSAVRFVNNEFDAMVAGLNSAFTRRGAPRASGGTKRQNDDGSWVWSWPRSAPTLSVVAAPSATAIRRANTADTFRYWAENLVPPGARSLLVVTTPVYVPYQSAIAVGTLGLEYGFSVETVGASATSQQLGDLSQAFETHHHLQELRSAIRGMRELYAALSNL